MQRRSLQRALSPFDETAEAGLCHLTQPSAHDHVPNVVRQRPEAEQAERANTERQEASIAETMQRLQSGIDDFYAATLARLDDD